MTAIKYNLPLSHSKKRRKTNRELSNHQEIPKNNLFFKKHKNQFVFFLALKIKYHCNQSLKSQYNLFRTDLSQEKYLFLSILRSRLIHSVNKYFLASTVLQAPASARDRQTVGSFQVKDLTD